MARTLHRLTDRFIKNVSDPGRYADGGNLYFSVTPSGSRRWVFLYKFQGRQREAGLGAARDVSLKEARATAEAMRRSLAEGLDPLAVKDAEEPARVVTFGEFADQLMDDIEFGFSNEKHRYQWRQTLGPSYCATIRPKPIDSITTDDVLNVIKPHWQDKQETASRLRGRIERVLDAARAKGLRNGDNPARWRGNLRELLPARKKLQRGHQPALPFRDVPAFVGRLRARQAISALALEFLILTAARSGEVIGATWDEIDLDSALWTIPAHRMKAKRQHRVPLARRALEILRQVEPLQTGPTGYVFPATNPQRPMSNMAFAQLLKRMGETGFVPHGFRSSFRDWCGEQTEYLAEVAEAALAHVVGSSVVQAYRRGDALDKRRALMEDWANFVAVGPTAS